MNWKLNKLTITNFKFFCEEFVFPANCQNILIYGENGSGKSSMYWSLYTIMQSCLKPSNAEATKYFDTVNAQNLRNKFSEDNDYSGIKIEFKHDDGRTKTYENSINVTNTSGDNFMRLTVAASGFMNYRFLSALFDFKNSEQNDVFPIFEKDIFPFLDFRNRHMLIDGDNYIQASTADSWWKYILRCHDNPNILPHSITKKNSILENTHQYSQFMSLLQDFNAELENRMREIILRVNDKLVNVFDIPISLTYTYSKAEFNKIKPNTRKAKDGKIHLPKIVLTAKLNHRALKKEAKIYHPKSFFNEAKLTIVALALRLSIYEMMLSNSPDCAELLIIDDLLVSLDMCNRMKIIDVILEYSNNPNKQMIFMTHDRALYNLIKENIKNNKYWGCYELYSKYEGYNDNEIPKPVLLRSESYLEQAHKHIKQFDFPAAANAIRKACENILNRILPENWQFNNTSDGSEQLTLHGLISQSKKLKEYFEIDLTFEHLDKYRDRILNPFSHDDLKTPLYRGELLMLLKDVEELEKIIKVNLTSSESVGKYSYVLDIPTEEGGGHLTATFVFLERFSIIKYEGKVYYYNSKIKVTDCVLPSFKGSMTSLRKLLKTMSNRARISYDNAYDYVFDPRAPKTLKDIADGT